jgi:hypothetical protein
MPRTFKDQRRKDRGILSKWDWVGHRFSLDVLERSQISKWD